MEALLFHEASKAFVEDGMWDMVSSAKSSNPPLSKEIFLQERGLVSSMVKRAVKGKLDTCGSVSLSHSSHLQDIKDCRKHGLKEVVLSGIGGQSKPLREAGVLHVDAANGKVKKILCYRFDCRQHG